MMQTRSERFWKNYRKKRRDSGSAYIIMKGEPLPSHEEMDRLDEFNMIYDIDPTIRAIVIELNERGFRTEGSCAGHIQGKRGFINIKGNPTSQKIQYAKQILKKYGLVNIRFNKTRVPGVWWGLEFNPVGIVTRNQIRKQFRTKYAPRRKK